MELVPKTGRMAGLQKHLALHQDHQVSFYIYVKKFKI
jgi:hypothetical protein